MNLLYYIAGRQGISPEELRAMLPHFEGGIHKRGVTRGPDGGGGCLMISSRDSVDALVLKPEQQRWVKMGDTSLWCGVDLISPPKPEDLRRRETFPGHDVVLADGASWHIPKILDYEGAIALPRKFQIVEGECVLGPIAEKYRALWDSMLRCINGLDVSEDEASVTLKWSELIEFLAGALSLNYCAGYHELLAMELFDSRNVWLAFRATQDRDTYDDIVKKNEPPQ